MANVHLNISERRQLSSKLAKLAARKWFADYNPVISTSDAEAEEVAKCWLTPAGRELNDLVRQIERTPGCNANERIGRYIQSCSTQHFCVRFPTATVRKPHLSENAYLIKQHFMAITSTPIIGNSSTYNSIDIGSHQLPPEIRDKIVEAMWRKQLAEGYHRTTLMVITRFLKERKTYGQIRRDWPELIHYVPSDIRAKLRATQARGSQTLNEEAVEWMPQINTWLATGSLLPEPVELEKPKYGVVLY